MVEPQPSKLMVWVRFPSPAPVTADTRYEEQDTKVHTEASQVVSYLVSRTSYLFFIAHVAQSVEHFLGKEEVIGSIPIMGSRLLAVSE